jgi:hypothetical protein
MLHYPLTGMVFYSMPVRVKLYVEKQKERAERKYPGPFL